MMIWVGIPLLLIAVWMVWLFNSLVSLHNQADAAWADIDVQLNRRYDLVPNLVAVVKGYAAHEAATFEKVATARTAALAAFSPAEKSQVELPLESGLRSLFALAEAYPALKANDEFLLLQKNLAEIEDNLQKARRDYNTLVRDLSIMQQQFPNNLLAPIFGVRPREYFQLDSPGQGQARPVEFGDTP